MNATTKTILKQIRKYIVVSVLKLSGSSGWITSLILDYVIKNGWLFFESKYEVEKKKVAYDKVKNNPESTVEDIGKSFHDLING